MSRFVISSPEKGFVLIEALAAFTIVTLIVGGLITGLTNARYSWIRAGRDMDALRIAQNQISMVLTNKRRLAPYAASGRAGSFSWSITARPYRGAEPNARRLIELRAVAAYEPIGLGLNLGGVTLVTITAEALP